jgi:hypothetical protein
MKSNQRWKLVPGYSAEVTKHGDVRDYVTKKIRNQSKSNGYCLVRVRDNYGKLLNPIGTHVLVALTFIGKKPSSKHQVNHKDLDKSNNYYKNLEWCTCKENVYHAIKNGIEWGGIKPFKGIEHCKGENHYRAKLTEAKVRKIIQLRKNGKLYRELSLKFNVSIFVIAQICHRKIWKHVDVKKENFRCA